MSVICNNKINDKEMNDLLICSSGCKFVFWTGQYFFSGHTFVFKVFSKLLRIKYTMNPPVIREIR